MKKRPVKGDNIKSDFGEYRTAAEKGQSFVFAGGKWKDMTDNDVKNILKTDFEPGNCRLYEKLGYKTTGKVHKINDKMDLVYYKKD